jgi:hypothetical protein
MNCFVLAKVLGPFRHWALGIVNDITRLGGTLFALEQLSGIKTATKMRSFGTTCSTVF